jgi:MFS family permease
MRRIKLYFGISVFWLALSMIFDGLNTLVLPDYLLNFITESQKATLLGLITFVGLLCGMLVQPIAGMWSDRLHHHWGRRGTIGVGTLLMLAALALLWLSASVMAIFISYVLIQMAASVAQASQQGFIPDLVPYERRGFAAGLKGFMDVGGALLGFVLVGMLLASGEIGWALLAMAFALIVTYIVMIILVREKPLPAPQQRFTLLNAFKFDISRHSVFTRLVIARFLFLLGVYAVGRFLLYFVADRLHLDRGMAAEQAGGLLAALTLVTVIAAPLLGWLADRYGRIHMMVSGSGVSVAGVLLMIMANSTEMILLAGSLMALGSAAFTGANWAMTADVTPPEEAARFMALANFGTAGAAAAAGLFGLLVDNVGYNLLFICAALVFVASALVLYQLPRPARFQKRMVSGSVIPQPDHQ